MAIVTTEGIIPERYDVKHLDNRDQGTTWVYLDGMHDYVEVDPTEIMGNMIENCYNEDVSFLFQQFTAYLTFIDHDNIKDDNNTDHIEGFWTWLSKMILQRKEDTGR